MKNLSIQVLKCLIVYEIIDFTHARAPKIHFVSKNDNLLVPNTKIDSWGVYVRFIRDDLFGPREGYFLSAYLSGG
jgi:hypothetical protein